MQPIVTESDYSVLKQLVGFWRDLTQSVSSVSLSLVYNYVLSVASRLRQAGLEVLLLGCRVQPAVSWRGGEICH